MHMVAGTRSNENKISRFQRIPLVFQNELPVAVQKIYELVHCVGVVGGGREPDRRLVRPVKIVEIHKFIFESHSKILRPECSLHFFFRETRKTSPRGRIPRRLFIRLYPYARRFR